jgi:hypothetical protein
MGHSRNTAAAAGKALDSLAIAGFELSVNSVGETVVLSSAKARELKAMIAEATAELKTILEIATNDGVENLAGGAEVPPVDGEIAPE